MKYRWLPRPEAPSKADWTAQHSLPEPVRSLMERRGLGPEILSDDYTSISSFSDLPGAEDAVSIIRETLSSQGRIMIHGDFDADGVTATATAVRVLQHLGASVISHIPCRFSEGYGLGEAGLELCLKEDVQLLITVDCGITALEQVAMLRSNGVKVVITDHHVPGPVMPEAEAIVDPELHPDTGQPWRHLSGAGVIHTVLRGLFHGEMPKVMLPDLVAVGTVCDMVRLTGDNRLLVREGLRAMREDPVPGISALLQKAGVSREVLSAFDLGFELGPRINSAGRLSHADTALDLLLTGDPGEAGKLAAELDRINMERKSLDAEVFEEARRELEDTSDPVAVAASSDWHPGVLGISASKLTGRLNRPVILISWEGDRGRGSARGVQGKPVHPVLARALDSGLLERFGGHSMAAGITISRDKYQEFRRFILQESESTFDDAQEPVLFIDGGLAPEQCKGPLLSALESVGPFGQGNPEPVWIARNLFPSSWRTVGRDGRHVQMTFQKNGTVLRAIGFDMGHRTAELGRPIDIAFRLKPDRWRGGESVQLVLEDIKPAAVRVN